MGRARTSRKQLFRAALAIAGITAEKWAESNSYSTGHLSRVLNGKQVGSADMLATVDAFIEKHVGAGVPVKQVA